MWKKLGCIFNPSDYKGSWFSNSFMTPTPFKLSDEVIRVYGGFRDSLGVSRIGYVDLSSIDPTIVLNYSKEPVLDIGRPGAFDDNGLILGDVIRLDNNLVRMYYVGFQKVDKVKFLAFTGMAESKDGGFSFTRYSDAPVLDRAENALYINAVHTAIFENGIWKFWCGVGDSWKTINNQVYPAYSTWYAESENGVTDIRLVKNCLSPATNEYRLGRPRVTKFSDHYEMLFTYDTIQKRYKAGYATSKDGIIWERNDSKLANFNIRNYKDFDNQMACYPSRFFVGDIEYLFYSGNGMGFTGLGLAKAVSQAFK